MSRAGKRSIGRKGYVDLQVNGYRGINFSNPGLSVADVRLVTEALVAQGTAAYCPTVVTSPLATYRAVLPVLAAAMAEPDLREHLLGIHIEGPFFTPEARGAHLLSLLRKPDADLFDRWQELAGGQIRLLTLAPEREGAPALIRHVVRRGVVVSLGHHMGDKSAIDRAIDAGAACCTHLGNGVANVLARHPNPIWTQLADDRLTGMFIADGHHLPAEFVRVALRAKGLDRTILTSDVSSVAGLPPGEYDAMGTTVVLEKSGRLSVKHSASLAGSSATMADCVAWLRSWSDLGEAELTQIARDNPLRLLGLAD